MSETMKKAMKSGLGDEDEDDEDRHRGTRTCPTSGPGMDGRTISLSAAQAKLKQRLLRRSQFLHLR
jgi:hypothetical protein